MYLANNAETDIYWFIIIIAGFFVILLLYGVVSYFTDFFRELKYINCEIRRNHGSERHYWIRRKRKLLLSLIPFVKY